MPLDLWNYALALYAEPGVEAACLTLQNEGADVCLLLCACWLQQRRVAIESSHLQALRGLGETLQGQLVAPLRAVRRGCKTLAEGDAEVRALRERLKGLELDAERLLLTRLQQCASGWPMAVSAQGDDWLACLAPPPHSSAGHDALATLRAATLRLQTSVD